jgi:hypothetical protein
MDQKMESPPELTGGPEDLRLAGKLDNRPTITTEASNATWVFDDGGRVAAGYRGSTGDCVCRAIAIATGKAYHKVYDDLNALAEKERTGKRKRSKSSARTGVYTATYRNYLESLGWRFVPTMTIGSGCRVHLRADELPHGRLIVSISKHLVAVIDGVIHDTHDPAREGTRCVYGYFTERVRYIEPAP